MQAKYKLFFRFVLVILFSISITGCFKGGCKKKPIEKDVSAGDKAAENSSNTPAYDAGQLLFFGNSEIENKSSGVNIPDYAYNKAISYYQQVVKQYPQKAEAIEAQFKIGKYTEEKIKYQNSIEIQYRLGTQLLSKDNNFDNNIKPFLKPYTQAINEYLKLHINRTYWSKLEGPALRKGFITTSDALLRAGNLLCDETNPRPDNQKAIEIYNIVFNNYKESGYADLALMNIINIYAKQNDWQQVINYALKFKQNFPQSSYSLDIEQKLIKANTLLNTKQ